MREPPPPPRPGPGARGRKAPARPPGPPRGGPPARHPGRGPPACRPGGIAPPRGGGGGRQPAGNPGGTGGGGSAPAGPAKPPRGPANGSANGGGCGGAGPASPMPGMPGMPSDMSAPIGAAPRPACTSPAQQQPLITPVKSLIILPLSMNYSGHLPHRLFCTSCAATSTLTIMEYISRRRTGAACWTGQSRQISLHWKSDQASFQDCSRTTLGGGALLLLGARAVRPGVAGPSAAPELSHRVGATCRQQVPRRMPRHAQH